MLATLKQLFLIGNVVCCIVTKLCPVLLQLHGVACKALLPMGFPRQQCWSRLPYPSPGELPDLGIEPSPPTLQVDSLIYSKTIGAFRDPSKTSGSSRSLYYEKIFARFS